MRTSSTVHGIMQGAAHTTFPTHSCDPHAASHRVRQEIEDDEDIEMSPVEPEPEPRRAPEPTEGMEPGVSGRRQRLAQPPVQAEYAATKKFTLRPFDPPLDPCES